MKIFWIVSLIVFVDQISKLYVKGFSLPLLNIDLGGFPYGIKVPVVGSFLNFTFVENPGIAFGIDFGAQYKILISIITIIITIGLVFYLVWSKEKNFYYRFSLALILAGAIGNLLDRLFYGMIFGYAPFLHGKVVDFLNIELSGLTSALKTTGYYVFNIADVSVTVGVIILFFAIHSERSKSARELKENNLLFEEKDL